MVDLGLQDDFESDASTTGHLALYAPLNGRIDYSDDIDWVRVRLDQGYTYDFELALKADGQQTAQNIGMIKGIFDANGDLVRSNSSADFQFDVAQTGEYFLALAAQENGIGSYRLSFETTPTPLGTLMDDFSQDSDTLAHIEIGSAAEGRIETIGDKDWFRIDLEAGEEYGIKLLGADSQVGSLTDPFLRGIYDASGDFVLGSNVDDGGHGLESAFSFRPLVSGTYFISAGGFAQDTGSYQVLVDRHDKDPHSDLENDAEQGIGSTTRLAIGGFIQGKIDASFEVDWYDVTLSAGVTYRFDLRGAPTASGTLNDPYIGGIYHPDGTFIPGTANDDADGTLNSSVSFTSMVSGSYLLSVGAFEDATGTYKLVTTDVQIADNTDDFGLWSDGAATLSMQNDVAMKLAKIDRAGDVDHFALNVIAGQRYQITQTGRGAAPVLDTYLHGVYSENGVLLHDFDDDSGVGLNSQITFLAETSGIVYISAGAYGVLVGEYELSVQKITADLEPSGATLGLRAEDVMSVGGNYSGHIDHIDDSDLIALSLVAGVEYQIDMLGKDDQGLTLNDPFLKGIYANTGELIVNTANDDGGDGLNARVRFTPQTSGTYYIDASAYDGTGSYSLRVRQVTTPAPINSTTVSSNFDIDIAYSGDAQYQVYFQSAIEFWETIILDDLPNIGGIDDLLIDVSVTNIDGVGGILGQAGATQWRDTYLPYRGQMRFDSADLDSMVADGTLQSVIRHEMGHVLGMSNLTWGYMNLIQGGYFIGEYATQVYSSWTGRKEPGVPIEQDYGAGTAGSHWDEEHFNTELMTGLVEHSGIMPISELTIASLADMGYTVNFAAVENYEFDGVYVEVLNGATSAPQIPQQSIGQTTSINVPDICAFSGVSMINYQDKSLWINTDVAGRKIDGHVDTLGAEDLWFFDTATGSNLLVHFVGEFEKTGATLASDVKGTVSEITVFLNGDIIQSRHFEQGGDMAVADVLKHWQSIDLEGNNYIMVSDAYENDDYIQAGAGDDVVIGGRGFDQLFGGEGNDTLVGGEGDDVLFDSWGDNQLSGDAGDDYAHVFSGDNTLDGGTGNDTLIGGAGNDVLIGDGTGRSPISDDRLIAGKGLDLLQGGLDNDVFVFRPGDGDNIIATFQSLFGSYQAIGADFDVHFDQLELAGFGFQNADAAIAAFDDVNGNATFEAQGTVIQLFGVSLAMLTTDIIILET